MSIELTTQVLSIQDLSQSEKHLLTILCFRANQNQEVYSSIKRLAMDCCCSIKTVERTLKKLRDMNYLVYTGKMKGKSHKIPIYCINLNHGQKGGDKKFITDNLSLDHGQFGNRITPKMGIQKDNINKDNKKNIYFSSLTHEETKELEYCIKGNFKLGQDFKYLQSFLDEAKKCQLELRET